jgi:beta-phosphoglucomutase
MRNEGEVRAVVWDLDGVLVDSGEAHRAAWIALGREINRPFTDEDFVRTFGMANPDIFRVIWAITDPADVRAWSDRKEILFRDQARALHPLPGAMELVRALRAAGWRQAIGSSAPRANITLLLDVLGLAGQFVAVVSGDDITRGKPDPQGFLLAFERLGVPPARGFVIEDAVAGVQAGKAAGAQVVAVTTTRARADLLAAGADLVVDTLTQLSVPLLEGRLDNAAPGDPA